MTFRSFRSRLAALMLLFASPGLAGIAVDAAHPCPENAPWTVETEGHHHDQQPAEHHDCKCVGACQTAVIASPASPEVVAVHVPVETKRTTPLHLQLLPVGRPRDRLPPATAPPTV